MKIYLISDTHFYHENIIKYCNRPFNNIEQMNEYIIKKWNKIVKKNDIVIHLGDFAYKGKAGEIRKKLNGTIILIRGNHDYNIKSSDGFFIVDGSLTINNLILSHRPIDNFIIPIGFINIHGHIHDKDSYNGINVSVEKTDYKPVLINKFIKSYNI